MYEFGLKRHICCWQFFDRWELSTATPIKEVSGPPEITMLKNKSYPVSFYEAILAKQWIFKPAFIQISLLVEMVMLTYIHTYIYTYMHTYIRSHSLRNGYRLWKWHHQPEFKPCLLFTLWEKHESISSPNQWWENRQAVKKKKNWTKASFAQFRNWPCVTSCPWCVLKFLSLFWSFFSQNPVLEIQKNPVW